MGRVRSFDPALGERPLFRALAWVGRQKPATWFLVNVGNRIDPTLMRISGGRLKTTINAPTVVLSHRGARSGKPRETPLTYFNDGDDVILIASRGGHRKHPAWYHNVRSHPEVELWTRGGGGRYRAGVAEGAERERLWALATSFYPGFATYQKRAGDRRIPVVVCEPLEDAE